MRRIPCPLRAIDSSACLHAHNAHHAQHAVASATHLRTSTASFSTTPTRTFLLPGKPNKKKHQQWVRRWQKRLLGDSEPIGAHVDPFDPTSPVRISPEEQGEYEEVLDLPENHELKASEWYEPAEHGKKLMRVGGEAWQKQKLEVERAREFEKLTLRTYTPMTLNMANEIEALTSTPYTLRDDNLYMAQTVHEVSGRPYTKYNFGLHKRPARADELRVRFVQAVAEVYTLRKAGLSLDLAKSPNQGIYDVPEWVRDIKLHSTASGELIVTFPEDVSAEDFIEAMQVAPAEEDLDLTQADVEEDLLVEEVGNAAEPVPTMDPATPEFKRAAVVKTDPNKKPFDFMSNRPVPRATPVESVEPVEPVELKMVEEVPVVQQPNVEPESVPSASARLAELPTKSEASQPTVSELQRTDLERRAQRITHDIAAMKKMANITPTPQADVKWHRVLISDDALKFAIFKRLYQLTGYRISDFRLSTSKTLGDLYDHVFDAAKPKPKSLHSALQIEAHKARERAKKANDGEVPSRKRADLGDLLVLGNVELCKKKASRSEQDTKKGMRKVIKYALKERGLPATPERRYKELPDRKGVVEGTRDVPQFGKPLSSKAANYLAEKIKQKKREEAERELQG